MIQVVIINEYLIIVAPFLNLKIKCDKVKHKTNSTGNKAGYSCMLIKKFPFSNSMKERCIPHPGQLIPTTCL